MIRAHYTLNGQVEIGIDEHPKSRRRLRRGIGVVCGALLALLVTSGATAANFGVNSKDDDSDNSIGDGTCWTGGWVFICRGGLLRMVQKSAEGGETDWIDTAAAYDTLSAKMKRRIEDLEARFDFIVDLCDMRFGKFEKLRHGDMGSVKFPEIPPVIHRIVWTHPESGRKSLNLSPLHLREVVGMDRREGDEILEELVGHATAERFELEHDWEVGDMVLWDMVLWDNWRTMHRALGIPPHCQREVQRTTINSERVIGRYA